MKELKEGIEAECGEALLANWRGSSCETRIWEPRESIFRRIKDCSRSALTSTPPKTASQIASYSKISGGKKPKMSVDIEDLRVYTVGDECRRMHKETRAWARLHALGDDREHNAQAWDARPDQAQLLARGADLPQGVTTSHIDTRLPDFKDASGWELVDEAIIDPFVRVSVHIRMDAFAT
ncbi:hypothetical protein HWV62_41026 [Athelia sp. TMB]|nr:hypothetical protein HWV62_41026 [Athelia sp. TMB]